MIRKRLNRLPLLILVLVGLATASQPQANDESKKSDLAFRFHSSSPQRTSPQKVKDKAPDKAYRDGEEWFDRGYELHSSDRYQEAIEAFKRSIDLGYRKATAMYNIACGYSLLNDKENALVWLGRALDSGFGRTDLLANDSDLDPLRTDLRFTKILESVSNANYYDKPWKEKANKKLDRLEQANLDFDRLDLEASKDGAQWFNVGLKLLRLRDLDRSIIALNRAITYLDYKGRAMYNLACAYALKGEREAGIGWLEKSVNAGFDSKEKLENDPDIVSLRDDPRFNRIERLSRTLSLSQFYGGSSDGSLYSSRQWAPAVELYESLVRSEPTNGRGWFNLGYALHYSREHARAIEAFTRTLQLGYRKGVSMYNIACAHAMLDQRDLAFQWLDRAVEAGYDGDIAGDQDFDNLRSDPRFKRFLDAKNGAKESRKE